MMNYSKQMMFVSIANSSTENSGDEGGPRISQYNPISIVGDSSIVGGGATKNRVKNDSSSANTNQDSYDINTSK